MKENVKETKTKNSSGMHCTAPVIVVSSFSFMWSYSTKLAEKGAWLFNSNESLSSETVRGGEDLWMQYGMLMLLQWSPGESVDKTNCG